MAEWWGDEGESWKTGSEGKRQRMAIYVDWLLTPVSERKPSTKKELADALDITTATLRNYTKDRWLQAELGSRARGQAKLERLPSILDSLYEQATDRENSRSVAAAKVYLTWLKETEAVRTETDLSEKTDEELAELTRELLNRQATSVKE